MKEFFKTLGVIEDPSNFDCVLYTINNPDGSPRWLWNATNPKPEFLKFYAINNLKAKLFSFLVQLIFKLKLQHIVFKKSARKVRLEKEHVLYPYLHTNFALFTGTEGPNRKLIVYAKQIFIKIALSDTSRKIIENEQKQLQIKQGEFYSIPQVSFEADGIIGISDVGKSGKRENVFSKTHALALTELYNFFEIQEIMLSKTEAFKDYSIPHNYDEFPSGKLIPRYLVQNLKDLENQLANTTIACTWSHGDFTPWNLFVDGQKLQLYDFELAKQTKPFAFDVFHFVMQQGILVEREPWKKINLKLKDAYTLLVKEYPKYKDDFETYLKAYLFINVSYYLKIYAKQKKWHTQIHWLLNTWNEAVLDTVSNSENQRKLFIGNIFDFLQNKSYAAIKFPSISPLELSENSDIDLLMHKEEVTALINYLETHTLVQEIQKNNRSNMQSLLIKLKNNQLLALDLIWLLKRKSLVFMNTDMALHATELNAYGVKVLNKRYTAKYLKYFYGLNGAAIPSKYAHYFDDNNLKFNSNELLTNVKAKSENKGLAGIKNKINYLMDSIKKTQAKKGIIITFSGVDGAGKSTIIEHTKHILEKKIRKQVVVIRHRPSLLPILSAYTQGKQKAEENAAKTLPRQGGNKSKLSSFFRFCYYYVDYLFGQFYVYFKYVKQGKVVLYDRYYFDFINDSRRSNIDLPKSLTKAGYRFLLKPDLNFFLYADPQTILARKKELKAEEIKSLTSDYLDLFKSLDKKQKNRYFPIENINLDETLAFITKQLHTKLLKNEATN